jgi:type IV pilus assembly protein PilA
MKSIKCPECGLVGWADSEHCKKCGALRVPGMASEPRQPQSTFPQYETGDRGHSPDNLKKGLAIASLVIGIVDLFTLGFFGVGAIVGITLAIVALNKAKHNPQEYGGRGMATAGLVTSIVSVALIVIIVPIGMVAAIAIPNLLASRRAANEGSSIAALRRLHSAEATYQSTTGNGAFGTLDDLAADGLITPELATGVRHGYKFTVDIRAGGYNEPAGFQAVGVPLTYGNTGIRSFYIDESGVIRAGDTRGAEATVRTPPLDN